MDGWLVILFLVSVLSTYSAVAQQKPLGSEIGFRYGEAPALSYRFYLQEFQQKGAAFELLFAKSGQSLLFTALYEKMQDRKWTGWYTYYGFGGSVGGWNDKQRMSLDMALGSCYYVPFLPLNVDFSLRPYLSVAGQPGVNAELALCARWVF
jgi:hypothetical protein